jgi:hypothetical protein
MRADTSPPKRQPQGLALAPRIAQLEHDLATLAVGFRTLAEDVVAIRRYLDTLGPSASEKLARAVEQQMGLEKGTLL